MATEQTTSEVSNSTAVETNEEVALVNDAVSKKEAPHIVAIMWSLYMFDLLGKIPLLFAFFLFVIIVNSGRAQTHVFFARGIRRVWKK
jgi:hypothetical protein